MVLAAFKNDKLKPLVGKTLAEVARMRHERPPEAAMDLVIEDGSRIGIIFFVMLRHTRILVCWDYSVETFP